MNSESPSMGSENTWNYIGEFLSSLQFTVLFSVLYVFVLISNMVLDIFPVSQPGFCDVLPPPWRCMLQWASRTLTSRISA